jgi:hypothetical protein
MYLTYTFISGTSIRNALPIGNDTSAQLYSMCFIAYPDFRTPNLAMTDDGGRLPGAIILYIIMHTMQAQLTLYLPNNVRRMRYNTLTMQYNLSHTHVVTK